VFLLALVGFVIHCSDKTFKIGEYRAVKIGDQIWMTENLNVDHYRNGDPIPEVQDLDEWVNLKTGAWCYYDNDPDNGEIYGKLYNWYAVNDPRGLAPEGWHIPTDKEWQILIDYLGGEDVAGDKMKENGTKHWDARNEGATNESGFTALPGGYRYGNGNFARMGDNAYFWSSTEYGSYNGRFRYLMSGRSLVDRYHYDWDGGMSVRCIRDNLLFGGELNPGKAAAAFSAEFNSHSRRSKLKGGRDA
jgi:uncharacterized protein (TIGR02145 family)